jgi:hypothetical protein
VKPQRYTEIAVVTAVLAGCAGFAGFCFPFQFLYYLVAGWAMYLYRVVPELRVSWSGVATAAVCLALLAVRLHRFLRWLYAARPPGTEGPARAWPRRWTAALLGVLVLMFVAGIAAVGVTHQTAWLATSPDPLLEHEPSARILSMNHMKQLSLGLDTYADTNGNRLPPYALFGPEGQPLLSWRVLILPYIEEDALFKEFRLDEPWDSPHNLRLLPRMPRTYAPASKKGNPKDYATFYQVFVGKGTAFEGRKGLHRPEDFPDGMSNTILIVEAASAVPWTKPADVHYFPDSPLPPLGVQSKNYFVVAMADGSVRTVHRKYVSETALRAAITRNGGEVLGNDW